MDTVAVWNQARAVGRGGVWFVAGVAVGTGYMDGATAITIAGAALTAVAGFLTSSAHTNSSVIQAASKMLAVKRLDVADPKLAEMAKKADPETDVRLDPPPKPEE